MYVNVGEGCFCDLEGSSSARLDVGIEIRFQSDGLFANYDELDIWILLG